MGEGLRRATLFTMKSRCRMDTVNGCWIWMGPVDKDGYGIATNMFIDGKEVKRAHRIAFYLSKGFLPRLLDHKVCDTTACINPDHLEPSTDKKNTLRGKGPTAINARKTNCPKGHPYSPKKTKHGVWRICKTCKAESRKVQIKKGH